MRKLRKYKDAAREAGIAMQAEQVGKGVALLAEDKQGGGNTCTALVERLKGMGFQARIVHYRYVKRRKLARWVRGAADFEPLPCGGRTECELVTLDGTPTGYKTWARCNTTDHFSPSLGARIALGRAIAQVDRAKRLAAGMDMINAGLDVIKNADDRRFALSLAGLRG